jgi:hypothetical protein
MSPRKKGRFIMEIIWLNPSDFVATSPTLKLTHHSQAPVVIVESSTAGSGVLAIALNLPSGAVFDQISVGYQVTNSATSINGLSVTEGKTTGAGILRHSEDTVLSSTVPASHTATIAAPFVASGAVSLTLRVKFASVAHKISIGAIGVGLRATCGNGQPFSLLTAAADNATEWIQEAIDRVAAAGGGTVRVPPGIHVVNGAIELLSNVHLKGSGTGATILKMRGDLAGTLDKANPDHKKAFLENRFSVIRIAGQQNATISDLRIDGNRSKNIYLGSEDFFDIDGGYQSGIAVVHAGGYISQPPPATDPTARSSRCRIENCVIENCVSDGIAVNYSNHIEIRDTRSLSNGLPERTMFGIILGGGTDSCVIERCSTFGNSHGGIELLSEFSTNHEVRSCEADAIIVRGRTSAGPLPVYHTISGCVVSNEHNPSGPCIVIEASCVTVRDCDVRVRLNQGITVVPLNPSERYKSLTFLNNRVRSLGNETVNDSPSQAIAIQDTDDLLVSGNIVIGPFHDVGLTIGRCRQGVVTGNTLRNSEYWSGDDFTSPLQKTRGIQVKGCQWITVMSNSVRGYKVGLTLITWNDKPTSKENLVLGNSLLHNDEVWQNDSDPQSADLLGNNIPVLAV